jgi:hypothetical protein
MAWIFQFCQMPNSQTLFGSKFSEFNNFTWFKLIIYHKNWASNISGWIYLPFGQWLELSCQFLSPEFHARWIISYDFVNKSTQLGGEIPNYCKFVALELQDFSIKQGNCAPETKLSWILYLSRSWTWYYLTHCLFIKPCNVQIIQNILFKAILSQAIFKDCGHKCVIFSNLQKEIRQGP